MASFIVINIIYVTGFNNIRAIKDVQNMCLICDKRLTQNMFAKIVDLPIIKNMGNL
jgi:hypothetical protein